MKFHQTIINFRTEIPHKAIRFSVHLKGIFTQVSSNYVKNKYKTYTTRMIWLNRTELFLQTANETKQNEKLLNTMRTFYIMNRTRSILTTAVLYNFHEHKQMKFQIMKNTRMRNRELVRKKKGKEEMKSNTNSFVVFIHKLEI